MYNLEDIIKNLPKLELCYEIITHKKVFSSDIIQVIPEGKKCLAWFTIYNNENICFILEIDSKINNKNIIQNSIICGTS